MFNWTQQLFSENVTCIKTLVIQKYMHTLKLSCSQTTWNDHSERSEVILCVTMHLNLVQSAKVKCGGGGPETNFVVY